MSDDKQPYGWWYDRKPDFRELQFEHAVLQLHYLFDKAHKLETICGSRLDARIAEAIYCELWNALHAARKFFDVSATTLALEFADARIPDLAPEEARRKRAEIEKAMANDPDGLTVEGKARWEWSAE